MSSHFSLIAIASQGILYLALGLFGMHSPASSILWIKSFHIRHSKYVFQMSPKDSQTCLLQFQYIDF